MEALPRDMILEILSRSSSLETLDRCKTVSKDWKQMIYEADFLSLHSRCVLGYLFQDVRDNKYLSALVTACGDVNWPSFDSIKIVAACSQGILCCEKKIDYKNYRYYVCKPSTNQWQGLPNPKLRYKTVVVAIVVRKSHPLRFSIVRLSELRPMKYKCEVFDSETWAWEETKPPIMSPSDGINCWQTSVTVGQSVYWLTSEGSLLEFDLGRMRFQYLGLPEEVFHHEFKRIGEYEGRLALTCAVNAESKTMELWVLRNESWNKKMKVERDTYRLVEFCNSAVAFVTSGDGAAALYNVENNSLTKLDVPFNLKSSNQIFPFRSDFEIVDLKPIYNLSLTTGDLPVTAATRNQRRRAPVSATEARESRGLSVDGEGK